MAYDRLILLAPCHGLEDFPLYHSGEDAESLLACWTALWHPLLLHHAKRLPYVDRCDYPSEEISNALLLVPRPCENELDSELPDRAESEGSKLIRDAVRRDEIEPLALDKLGEEADRIDGDLVQDFYAFGFAFLQVAILTQQMRYASGIDESQIEKLIKQATTAAVEGNAELCREKLTSCHDALTDERNHYYPVDVYLVDLTMLATAESTLGATLDGQLSDEIAQNFMASGETIEKLAQINPGALQRLRELIEGETIGFAGGEWSEAPLPLLTPDTLARQLQRGSEVYQQHLGAKPNSFARRKHGLYPTAAQIIRDAGYDSALHLKFDAGHMPESLQGRTKWEIGTQGLLDCYARPALDASLPDTFLNLATNLSETMDSDHVATRMFIHWPGHVSDFYRDLRRCARFGSALGKFVTLKEYFDESDCHYEGDEFRSEDYAYRFLEQAGTVGESSPVSKYSQYWYDSVRWLSLRASKTIATALNKSHDFAIEDGHEHPLDNQSGMLESTAEAKAQVDTVLQSMLCPKESSANTVFNPFSFPRRILLRNAQSAHAGEAVYASGKQEDGSYATLVDVPACGFATVRPASAEKELAGPMLGEELSLRNERMQVLIDRETGALRALKDYKSRTTRLSQQIAFRITIPKTGDAWVDRQSPVAYSVMAADSVELTANGQIFAEITARGRLLALNGEVVGEFEQRYQLTRGSRILVIAGEIKPVTEVLLEEPWDSYYACRFAFGDEGAILRTGASYQTHDTNRRRLLAPLFVDIDSGKSRTTLLTGGLPYHRRVKDAELDTLVYVSGESSTCFRVGVGLDLPSPVHSAVDFLDGINAPTAFDGESQSESGWLFHIDAKNLIATNWQPIEGGVRIRLVETQGRKSKTRIRCFKPIREARRVDTNGNEIELLEVVDGEAVLLAEPQLITEVQLTW